MIQGIINDSKKLIWESADNSSQVWQWFGSKLKSEIAEACKKQREICSMEIPMYPFTPDEFDRWQLAILNAPSPLEEKK